MCIRDSQYVYDYVLLSCGLKYSDEYSFYRCGDSSVAWFAYLSLSNVQEKLKKFGPESTVWRIIEYELGAITELVKHITFPETIHVYIYLTPYQSL